MTNHAVVTHSENVLDQVMLWHQWLRHMSENCLKIMHDRGIFVGIKSCDLDLCEHYNFGKHKRVWYTTSSCENYDIL